MLQRRFARMAELLILLGLAVMLACGAATERQQQSLSGKILRLHVRANSDSEEDRQIKLQVRDAVLETAGSLLSGAGNVQEAREILSAHLDQLSLAANSALQDCGAAQTAAVSLGRELFGTREYDTFRLPGGWYDALRVDIGEAEGANWWCVVYPQICTAAAEDQEAVAVMGGLDPEEFRLLEGETAEYKLKFRCLELLENLLGWVRGGSGGIPVSR